MKIYEIIVGTMQLCLRAGESRLEGDGAGLLGSTRDFLLLHDSLVGSFYRNGKTELGGALCCVSGVMVFDMLMDIPSCGQSRQRR